MQTKLKETRKRGPNLTESPPSKLKNESEKREDEKESFSSENPRVGKVNKKGTKKKLGNLSLQTIALKGKDVHKTLTFLAAKGWERRSRKTAQISSKPLISPPEGVGS